MIFLTVKFFKPQVTAGSSADFESSKMTQIRNMAQWICMVELLDCPVTVGEHFVPMPHPVIRNLTLAIAERRKYLWPSVALVRENHNLIIPIGIYRATGYFGAWIVMINTGKIGDALCIVPTVNPVTVTPHSEAFQGVVWHLAGRYDNTARPNQPAFCRPEMSRMSFAQSYLQEARQIIDKLDIDVIDRMANIVAKARAAGGRLFFLGVGGSAGNCSHAVNDFRKIVGIESYAPTDNVSELTARINDEGWETVFVEWLKTSRLRPDDVIFVFSVGGGNLEKNVSPNLVRALQFAKEVGSSVIGVVGRDGGYTGKVGDAVCIIPTVNPATVTPHSEAFQAVVWHLLVTHPALKAHDTKWESVR